MGNINNLSNLELFVLTVPVYFIIWRLLYDLYCCVNYGNDIKQPDLIFCKEAMRHLCIIAVLCLPLSVNNNVFTVFGNVSSTVTKNSYSVFSPYQSAENSAVSILGSIDQKAGNKAIVLFGLVIRQNAKRGAITAFGIAGFQKSEVLSGLGLGISGIQKGKHVGTVVGLSVYQHGFGSAQTALAMAIYQRAGDKVRNFAIWSKLKAK